MKPLMLIHSVVSTLKQASNLATAIAYLFIVCLIVKTSQEYWVGLNEAFRSVALLFASFIFVCGTGHLISHVLLPVFPRLLPAAIMIDALTAFVSLWAAIRLRSLLPLIDTFAVNRRQTEQLLRDSEERFRGFANYSPAVQAIKAVDGTHLWINQRCQEVFGEITGRKGSEWLPPDQWEETLRNDLQVWSTGQPLSCSEKVATPDGATRYWHIVKFPLHFDLHFPDHPDQRFIGLIAFDETAQVEAEQKLLQSNAELEHFAYIASHDLRAPLRSILAFSEKLQQSLPQLDAKPARYLKNIVSAGTWMHQLVNDLLIFSRAARETSSLTPVNLAGIVSTTIANLNTAIQETNTQLVVQVPGSAWVQGIESELVQVVQNLISNAIKFQATGTRPQICITAELQSKGWMIHVSDNGIGIEPRFQQQIFDLFERLHTREEYEGTGMGLAICKRVIERHGGTLTVASTPGQGSTFSFSIKDSPHECATR